MLLRGETNKRGPGLSLHSIFTLVQPQLTGHLHEFSAMLNCPQHFHPTNNTMINNDLFTFPALSSPLVVYRRLSLQCSLIDRATFQAIDPHAL
ncbi:hypothetical protein HZ326_31253 [Fusarium oxysporum f. sp. albedinis]|nr:hypothetical protein HZ326_31253 [Fusarium oxysporum f. sp. albedinis]